MRKKEYSSTTLSDLSLAALSNLEQLEEFRKASHIALYHALPGEVETVRFIEKWEKEKQLYLPFVDGDNLKLLPFTGKSSLSVGSYGILEPCGAGSDCCKEQIDLLIVPGIAFDRERNRMGRGKGYYDRLLSDRTVLKIGLCFHFQLLETIPTESFDIPMDRIVTDQEII